MPPQAWGTRRPACLLPKAGARLSSPDVAWLGFKQTAAQLGTEAERPVFTALGLDLDNWSSVQSALAELSKWGRPIKFLLLNAGWIGRKERVLTAAGVEVTQAPLIGHHQLTLGLLRANLLGPNARIVIAGSELARGDVPLFPYTDIPALAARDYQGDRSAAVEDLLRGGPKVKYEPNRAHSDAKMIVACGLWWAAALSRRLPSGMAVYAVSPGSTPDTSGLRNAGPALKWLMVPLMKLIPGMSHTPETAVRRYLQASEFGTDVSGQFFASAPKRFTGPMEAMRQPHFPRPRQPGSCVAGHRQGVRRRPGSPIVQAAAAFNQQEK